MTLFAPYFYAWGRNHPAYKVGNLLDARAKVGLKAVTLAFATASPDCIKQDALFDTPYTEIRNFIQSGGHVILSVGGANGPFLEQEIKDDNDLFNVVDHVLRSTGIRALDFDVEGGVLWDDEATARRIRLMQRLRLKYPAIYLSYTLPVLPYKNEWNKGGLTSGGLKLIQATEDAHILMNVINLMTMDFGAGMITQELSYGQHCISCVDQVVKQLKEIYNAMPTEALYWMMGMTPMLGENDTFKGSPKEVFTLSDAAEVVAFAKQKKLALLSCWSLQRDQVGKDSLAIHSMINQADFEFYNELKKVDDATPVPAPVPVPTPAPVPVPAPAPAPVGNISPWSEGLSYKVGDLVSYGDKTYLCIQAHVAHRGTGWNPVASPTLWAKHDSVIVPIPAPSPTPSPEPLPEPQPSPGDSMPNRIVAGYLPNWGGYPVRLTNFHPAFNLVYIFHATPAGNGNLNYTPLGGTFVQDCRAFRATGRKLFLTVGGAGAGFGLNSRGDSNNFLASFDRIYNQLGGLDGLDWNNFEANQAPTTDEMIYVSKTLKSKYPGFMVSCPPAPWQQRDKDFCLAMLRAGALDFAGPQFYDGPGQNVAANLLSHLASWVPLLGQDKVVVGFGIRAAANYWTAGMAADCLRTILQRYPNIRGIFDWDLNYENQTGNQFAKVVAPVLGGVPAPAPAPTPAPVPVPTPAPVPSPVSALIKRLQAVNNEVQSIITELGKL